MAQKTELPVSTTKEEPAWKQRAVERSTRAAKIRAEQRVVQFLDAAQAIISEKGSLDLTVQEVVDRSRQSLRSFYQHFSGKHELLLALFENALSESAEEIRAATETEPDPVNQLQIAVRLLFEQSHTDQARQRRPLFTDFAPQLLVSHPAEVRVAHAPLLTLITEMMTRAAEAGQLRTGLRPRRAAAMVMQTAMFLSQSNGVAASENAHPITVDEAWEFCFSGFAGPGAVTGSATSQA
ncbi:TetR family transcriptional regulator [Frankia sp. R43]|uniref:TetR/AcrR family transcriptional regulator n=1 Tax=Frankia sp. R43 TaxID=269536 RepID=UPI0006CA370E|nr:TetR/AcrR family transcriptional regulator [Frankia sp. R43]KPM51723.1 TetR family transcriptional regulator [Frankia sp. R43]